MSSKLIFVLLGAPLEGGVGAAGQICANFATFSWEPLTMLNPHFVAGEHGLFGAHESEYIRTISIYPRINLEENSFLKKGKKREMHLHKCPKCVRIDKPSSRRRWNISF